MVINSDDIRSLKPNKDSIVKKIIEIRKKKKFSQAQMAEKLGIPRTTYAYHESGNFAMSYEYLETIARILDVSIFEFINPGIETPKTDGVVPDTDIDTFTIDDNKQKTVLKEPKTVNVIPPEDLYIANLTHREDKLIKQLHLLPNDFRKKVFDYVNEEYLRTRVKKK